MGKSSYKLQLSVDLRLIDNFSLEEDSVSIYYLVIKAEKYLIYLYKLFLGDSTLSFFREVFTCPILSVSKQH